MGNYSKVILAEAQPRPRVRERRLSARGPIMSLGSLYAYCNNSPANFTDPTGMRIYDDGLEFVPGRHGGRLPCSQEAEQEGDDGADKEDETPWWEKAWNWLTGDDADDDDSAESEHKGSADDGLFWKTFWKLFGDDPEDAVPLVVYDNGDGTYSTLLSDGHVEDYDSSRGSLAVIEEGGYWWDKGAVSGVIENAKFCGGTVGVVAGQKLWENKAAPYAGLLGLKLGAGIERRTIPW